MRFSFSSVSLRTRLILLVAASVIPALAVLVFQGIQEYDTARLNLAKEAENVTYRFAAFSKEVLPEPREYLAHLAAVAEVQQEGAECQAFLAATLKTTYYLDNLLVIRPTGEVVCAGAPQPAGLNLSDTTYFRRALQSKTFAIGDFQPDTQNRKPILVFASPTLDAEGKVTRVIALAVNLSWFGQAISRALANTPHASGVAAAAADNAGVLVAAAPQHGFVNKNIEDWEYIRAQLEQKSAYTRSETWRDGMVRTTAYVPLYTSTTARMYLRVGIPRKGPLAEVWQDTARNSLIVLLTTLLAIAAAWLLSSWLILRPIGALTRTAARLGEGVMSARTGLARSGGEIGELARRFDDMAEQLQLQHEALLRVSRVQAVRGATNSALVRAASEDDLLGEICKVIRQIGGYHLACVGYAQRNTPAAIQIRAHDGTDELLEALSNPGGLLSRNEMGPLASAISSGRVMVFHDLATSTSMAAWRRKAASCGCACAIGLPLKVEGEVIGALGIFSVDPSALGPEEIQLLTETANDVALGISALRSALELRRSREFFKKNNEQLIYLATHDVLTGLANRSLLMDKLSQAWTRAQHSQDRLAVLYIDLDGFKEINDTLGHMTGDDVLKEVAKRLRVTMRNVDTIARVGGDEFVVLIETVSDLTNITAIAERIKSHLATPLNIAGREIFISSSIGISVFPGEVQDYEALLRTADIAMYHAKSEGRNTHAYYSPDMDALATERLDMRNLLRHALERDELILHYQPKISISTGRIVGAEALVRWNSGELGWVAPNEFIPLAEQSGLIVPIGDWVLQTACAQARQWQDQGLPPIVLAVNLSPRQFRQAELARNIIQTLSLTGLAPGYLELEVTEGTIMDKTESAIALLGDIHRAGIRLAVDDFGTGYSSLEYLKRLPVNSLKIDRSFVQGLTSGRNDAAIVTAVIAMAKSLNLTVTAEGVETAEQLEVLKTLGCDEYQGFLFCQPVTADAFGSLLEEMLSGS